MYKYKILIFFSLLVLLTLLSSCSKKIIANKTPKQYYYTCPMHPADIYYLSGNCPKCGMALEQWEMDDYSPKKASSTHREHSNTGSSSGSCH